MGTDPKKTLEELIHAHRTQLYRFALYLTRKENEAQDLVQETWMRTVRFFDRFEAGTNFKAWIFAIMNNVHRSEQRKRFHEMAQETGHLPELSPYLDAYGQAENPEILLLKKIPDMEVQNALRSLPEEFRAAVVLCDIEEMSYREIAEIMDCPIGTVRSRVARGRRQLYAELSNYARREGIVRKR